MTVRIALLVSAFPRASETFIVSKFAGLVERGWDAHVICTRTEPSEWKRFESLGRPGTRSRVHVEWPDLPRWRALLLLPAALLRCLVVRPVVTLRYLARGWRRFGMGVFWNLYLDAELVCLAPELVHFEFGSLSVRRLHLGELLGCRILVSFRGYDLNHVGIEDAGHYSAVWRTADALHFLGEDLWRRAQRLGCPPEKRHALIPPAIDTDYFQPTAAAGSAPAPGRSFRILGVGRLEWKKGYEDAMAAVRALLDMGIACEYRILGSGDDHEALGFARHQLGLEEVVAFVGAGSRLDVRQEMERADVLLHAAVSEGFCNAVIEAQAMCLPVVCTDAGGLPENVKDGETGFVVARRDPAALAEKLAVLARDADLRGRMGMAGRRRALDRFRLDGQLDAFERLYRDTMEHSGKGLVLREEHA